MQDNHEFKNGHTKCIAHISWLFGCLLWEKPELNVRSHTSHARSLTILRKWCWRIHMWYSNRKLSWIPTWHPCAWTYVNLTQLRYLSDDCNPTNNSLNIQGTQRRTTHSKISEKNESQIEVFMLFVDNELYGNGNQNSRFECDWV
jgi:hypothetical protein